MTELQSKVFKMHHTQYTQINEKKNINLAIIKQKYLYTYKHTSNYKSQNKKKKTNETRLIDSYTIYNAL